MQKQALRGKLIQALQGDHAYAELVFQFVSIKPGTHQWTQGSLVSAHPCAPVLMVCAVVCYGEQLEDPAFAFWIFDAEGKSGNMSNRNARKRGMRAQKDAVFFLLTATQYASK
jgi:hypothetical protein